jgi:hypothetical protein
LKLAYQQSQVRSVIDSYHGRIDVFAEATQNSIDAVEKRWSTWPGPEGEQETLDSIPRVRIILDFDTNSIEVIDNGTGIDAAQLEDLLEPFMTDKRTSDVPLRGHKGVGTTFLAYGHPKFEIHTKTKDMQEAVGYSLEGGRAWATNPTPTEPPDFVRVSSVHPALGKYESGTYVKIGLDQTTNLKSLSGVIHNTPLMWSTILRSNTAVGYVSINEAKNDRPKWMQHIKITVEHPDGPQVANFEFPYPHLPISAESRRELQSLQNSPESSKREYELIYVERKHEELKNTLLKKELGELENREEESARSVLAAFNRYKVSIYASLAHKNTFYEEQFNTLIKTPDAKKFSLSPGVGGGVMVASMGMPMGGIQSHLFEKMQPQYRRRYFLLVHFNEHYSPDIGRKTIPQEVEDLVTWLESELLGLLGKYQKRLLRDRAEDTRPKGATLNTAAEELKEMVQKIVDIENFKYELNYDGLILQRSPNWEAEVVATFLDIVSKNKIPGYTIRAIPGTESRYDALFDYALTTEQQTNVPESLRVSPHQLGTGIHLTAQWLEFKKDINSFISDLEEEGGSPAKKYFNHVNLLVTWTVSDITSEIYSVTPINASNLNERVFVGTTHYLETDNNDHRVEVMCLQEVIQTLFGTSNN